MTIDERAAAGEPLADELARADLAGANVGIKRPEPESACRQCGEDGNAYSVQHTLMGGGAEQPGHDHDPNTWTAEYRCKNGHRWLERWTRKCQCGWQAKGTMSHLPAYEVIA